MRLIAGKLSLYSLLSSLCLAAVPATAQQVQPDGSFRPASLAEPDEAIKNQLAQWTEQLVSDSPEQRYRAANALGAAGPAAAQAVPALRAALQDKNYEVRWCVIDALGRLGETSRSAVGDLVRMLDAGDDRDSRRLAARALGHLGPVAAAAEVDLTKALDSPDRGEAVEAALALWRIDQSQAGLARLAKLVADQDDLVAFSAALALADIGQPARDAVAPLIDTLARDNADVRRAAARALGMIGPAAIERLAAGLKDFDGTQRASAVAALGMAHRQMRVRLFDRTDAPPEELEEANELAERVSIPTLAALLKTDDQVLLPAVTRALAEAGPAAVAPLAQALAAGGEPSQAAADALGDLLDRLPTTEPIGRFAEPIAAAQVALAKSLAGEPLVRRTAARVLCLLPFKLEARTVAALRGVISTDDAATRYYAAQVLRRQSPSKSDEQ